MTNLVMQGEVELVRRFARQIGEVVVLGLGFVVGAIIVTGAGSMLIEAL